MTGVIDRLLNGLRRNLPIWLGGFTFTFLGFMGLLNESGRGWWISLVGFVGGVGLFALAYWVADDDR